MKANWHDGNSVELLINGEEFFPRVFDSIRNAKTEVLLETFILSEDKVGNELQQALISAAKRGVRVEITADDYGTWDLSADFVNAMTEVGIHLHIFDPQPKIWGVRLNIFRRLHRKIVVIDRQKAFIGGINYSADHLMDFGKKAKQDYAVEVHGPIVADIHHSSMLLLMRACSRKERRNYLRKDKPIPPKAGDVSMAFSVRDNWGHRRDIELQYMLALKTAKNRIVIANAYFFPGYRLLRELRRASLRGVDVTLILQGQPDMPWVSALSRLLYSYLIRSGVEIREYCRRPLHGKVAVVDNEWATVGSSNLDPLSLSLNMEANLMIKDSKFNNMLYEHLINLGKTECKPIDMKVATRGYWWRTPLIFLSFHFLRYFPTLLGWLPAHTPTLELIMPHKRQWFGKSPGLKELVDDDKITDDFKSINKNIYDKEEV